MRRLEPYLDRRRHWGNWYPSKAERGIYNVEWGYYEIPVDEVRTYDDLIDWVRHYYDKAWPEQELRDLVWALSEMFDIPRGRLRAVLDEPRAGAAGFPQMHRR